MTINVQTSVSFGLGTLFELEANESDLLVRITMTPDKDAQELIRRERRPFIFDTPSALWVVSRRSKSESIVRETGFVVRTLYAY